MWVAEWSNATVCNTVPKGDTGPVVDGKYSFKLNAIFDTDGDIDVREFLRRIKAIHVDAVLHYHILL